MIELKDIVVKFGDFEALHNINVEVKEGEFFTFKPKAMLSYTVIVGNSA